MADRAGSESLFRDLEERLERLETLVSCLVIHGDNLPSFDNGPAVAREIVAEIRRDLQEANPDA